jgi:phosphoesterase RecJ-like protein
MRELAAAARRLATARRVWLGTHLDPDGDAVGSLLGLGWILADRGTAVDLACQDPVPAEVRFLPGVERIGTTGPGAVDVAVALDTADAGRLGTLYAPTTWAAQPTIVLDHHASNPGFGDIDVIDPSLASTAELVLALAEAMAAPVGVPAATCLLTGLVTDTIGFRTANTTAQTLCHAVELMRLGAPLAEISQQVFFSRPLAALRLAGRALDRLRIEGPVAVTYVTLADLAELGVAESELRGLTSLVSTAAEPAAVALLRERPDGRVDVSLRSKPAVDLLAAAAVLGGGGHPQASGARVDGPLEAAIDRVLAALASIGPLPEARPDGAGGS